MTRFRPMGERSSSAGVRAPEWRKAIAPERRMEEA